MMLSLTRAAEVKQLIFNLISGFEFGHRACLIGARRGLGGWFLGGRQWESSLSTYAHKQKLVHRRCKLEA